MGGRMIAVDFDGTLCRDAYPDIGEANTGLIRWLREQQAAGDRLILWTCRQAAALADAVAFCGRYGLHFDAVNENLPEVLERYGTDSRKICADLYIDDRSIQPWIFAQTDIWEDETHEAYEGYGSDENGTTARIPARGVYLIGQQPFARGSAARAGSVLSGGR